MEPKACYVSEEIDGMLRKNRDLAFVPSMYESIISGNHSTKNLPLLFFLDVNEYVLTFNGSQELDDQEPAFFGRNIVILGRLQF